MINTWNYNDFMYRLRDEARAGCQPCRLEPGTASRRCQRSIGGGMVRTVRAMKGIWDKAREHGREATSVSGV